MLLVGINSKYVHTNLAIRYIDKLSEHFSFAEFSITDRPENIAASLYKTGKKRFWFSCYIWNIETILKVACVLKGADESIQITVSGPEVSFGARELLEANRHIDFVLCGEGEPSAVLFLEALKTGAYETVPGLYYRTGDEILASPLPPEEADLECLPFPYTEEDVKGLQNRILYFETSRGCPYRCAFCLSGASGSLRFMSLEKVKEAISFFAEHKVPLVKLVDRTFNADPERALKIIEAIKESGGGTTYHFEIRAESMTRELIKALQTAPAGMFQLEIGVQSVHAATLERVNRKLSFEKLSKVVWALLKNQNIHLHLDLIAGLPSETKEEFMDSFHQVFSLKPHNLQLGFLKKLKGSALKAEGSVFADFPPYEIIKSDAMSYDDLLELKRAEDMLERFYNSGIFKQSISYILETYYKKREFYFFSEIAGVFEKYQGAVSQKNLFEALYDFCAEKFEDENIKEAIIYDYCLTHKDSLSFMSFPEGFKEKSFAFLKNEKNVKKYFVEFTGLKPAEIYKKIRFVPIGASVFAFFCGEERAVNVTKEFESEE